MVTLKTSNEITEYLKSQNKPYDYTSRSNLYKQFGLEDKYGSYVGSGQQNNAIMNLSKEATRKALGLGMGETAQMMIDPRTGQMALTGYSTPQAKTTTPTTYPSPQVSTIKPATTTTGDLGFPKSSAEYDQWIKMGRQFIGGKWVEAGTTGTTAGTTAKPTLETISKGVQEVAAKTQALTQRVQTEGIAGITQPKPPSVGDQPTQDYINLDTKDDETIVNNTIEDVAKEIGTTDIATLIGQFSSGELTTPEMEITAEGRQAQLDKLKTDTASALQKLQQNMAKRGMTFSGIRTQAEANLAAETLSVQAGINRDFAARIVNAARQEQTRRETALQAAEQGYNKALETAGYVYNPFLNVIQKSLAREKFEAGEAREQATFEREETEAFIEQLSSNIFTMLSDDPQANADLIQQFANTSGLPVSSLMTEINKLQSSDYKDQLGILKLEADLAKATDPLDRQYKLAQITKLEADIAKIYQDTAGTSTGKILGGVEFTPNKNLSQNQLDKISVIESGLNFVDQAERLYYEAVGGEYEGIGAGIAARVKGVGRWLGEVTGVSEAFSIYTRFLDSNRATIAKGIKGEVGNLAKDEQKNALKSFPGRFSSPKEAVAAFENIRNQMQDQLETLGIFNGVPNFGELNMEDDFNQFIME